MVMTGDAIIYKEGLWLQVYSPWNQNVIDDFKALPKHLRRWDPDGGCWSILSIELASVIRILKDNGLRVSIKEASTSAPLGFSSAGTTPIPQLFAIVPRALHQSLYRHLAIVFHPDRGGSDTLMKALNITWDQIKEGRDAT